MVNVDDDVIIIIHMETALTPWSSLTCLWSSSLEAKIQSREAEEEVDAQAADLLTSSASASL